ncbi:MAG: hypothetical protein A3E82_09735 [Gammaproteobacteria bacterium RIFCSPHIGHO2_12_FULL_38_11]|nr:MAG: hypothetical protein A3E82_09735 [Gammaproteobacteria bacterium RIFCSPHIGHO2_12_FULL_38_11]
MIYAGKFGPFFFVMMIIITFFYCLTLVNVMKLIPPDKHKLPIWLVWFFLIPVIGLIFQWVIMPFEIPATLKRNFSDNKNAHDDANLLFKIGLAQVIFATSAILISIPPFNDTFALLELLTLILYWMKIVKFKRTYFQKAA